MERRWIWFVLASALAACHGGHGGGGDSGHCVCDVEYNGVGQSLVCGQSACVNGEQFQCGSGATIDDQGPCVAPGGGGGGSGGSDGGGSGGSGGGAGSGGGGGVGESCGGGTADQGWTVESCSGLRAIWFSSVWGSSATDIYVGGEVQGPQYPPQILRSGDEETWSALDAGQKGFSGRGIWGSGADDVYLVGEVALVMHTQDHGQSWQQQTTPTDDTTRFAVLNAIWGSGPGDVYAVGSASTVLHLNQGTWTREPVNLASAEELTAVWGSGPNDVYAVGDNGTILHSSGLGTWDAQPSGTADRLQGIWGASSKDLLVAGNNGVILRSTGDGSWTRDPSSPGSTFSLYQLWGDGAGNVYTVGDSYIFRSQNGGPWSYFYVNNTNLQMELFGVWGIGSKIFAVGMSDVSDPVIVHN